MMIIIIDTHEDVISDDIEVGNNNSKIIRKKRENGVKLKNEESFETYFSDRKYKKKRPRIFSI